MNKKNLLLALAAVLPLASFAESISEEEARQLAQTFLNGNASMTKSKVASTPQLSLAGTVAGAYLFNNGQHNGFVIVSNIDNASDPILGYSDSGTLSMDLLPDNLKWWLEQLQREASYTTTSQSASTPRRSSTASDRKDIAPLLKTEWHQRAPFNNLCPDVETKDENGKTVTVKPPVGCVATAMAQVMYYHKWPATYDWDNMIANYTKSDYNEAQATAVATLLRDLGKSLKMEYGVNNSDASVTDEAYSLFNEYGYDRTVRFRFRNNYSVEEWETMLYNELEAGRPVSYGGQIPPKGTDGGHAFVLDGYESSTGKFHFNWGWAGTSDGYFALTALNPERQGTGGGDGLDFSAYQRAIFGIQPMTEGSTSVMEPQFYYSHYQTSYHKQYQISKEIKLLIPQDVITYDIEPSQIYLGVKLTNKEDESEYYYIGADEKESVTKSFTSSEGTGGFNLNGISTFPTTSDGSKKTFIVQPTYQIVGDDTWHDCVILYESSLTVPSHNLIAVVTGTTVTLSMEAKNITQPSVTKIEAPETVDTDKDFTISFTFSPDATYEGTVYLVATSTTPGFGALGDVFGEDKENSKSIDTSNGAPIVFDCNIEGEYLAMSYEGLETPSTMDLTFFLTTTNGGKSAIKGSTGHMTVRITSDGISTPALAPATDASAIYTLCGQRVERASQPGIYIQGGKKHIVK